MIDFVVLSFDLWLYVLDTRVKSGAELATDHHLVVSWIRGQGRKPDRPGRPKQVLRVCCECFADDPVKMVFNSHVWRSFNHIPKVGSWNLSGSCSALSMLRWLLKADVAWSLVLVVAATPGPAGGHQRWKGPSSWRRRHTGHGWPVGPLRQQTATGRPSDLQLGWSLRQNPGVGRVWWGYGKRHPVCAEEILANCLAAQEGKAEPRPHGLQREGSCWPQMSL